MSYKRKIMFLDAQGWPHRSQHAGAPGGRNFTIDLLSNYSFPSCKLLESHTGKIKPKTYWNSKLSGKDSGLMPFNAMTLQIFGDGENFAAYPRKLKLELIELAKKNKWSPITTNAKVESDLNKMTDKLGAQMLKDMLRNKPR